MTAEASGIHEVFVYTPDHDGGIDRLDDEAAAEFMRTLKRRLSEHAAASGVRYTQVIVNHGRIAGRRSPIRTPRSSACRSFPVRSSTRSGRSPASPAAA